MATGMQQQTVHKDPPTIEQPDALRKDEWCTDLEFVSSGGELVRAHRAVMGASCPALKQEIENKQRIDLSRFSRK